MDGKPLTREESAWHEAGHVVAAWVLGGEPLWSSARRWLCRLRAGPGIGGHTHSRFGKGTFCSYEDARRCVAIIKVAGAVSQHLHTGEQFRTIASRYALEDFRQAAGILGIPIHSSAERGKHTVIALYETGDLGISLNSAVMDARRLLAAHEPLTGSVAGHLSRHWRMGPRQFRRLEAVARAPSWEDDGRDRPGTP